MYPYYSAAFFIRSTCFLVNYFLFCLSFIICSCCFCMASRRAAKPVFFIFFGSFLLASNWARSASSLVVLRMMSVVTTLINVEMK